MPYSFDDYIAQKKAEREKEEKRDQEPRFPNFDPETKERLKATGKALGKVARPALNLLEGVSKGVAGVTYFPITRTAENIMQGEKNPLEWAKDLAPIPFVGKEVWGSDLLKEAGMKDGWGRTLAGMGLDILGDPLSYVSLGATKAGRLARLADVAVPGSKVAQGVDKLKAAGKFVPWAATATERIEQGQQGAKFMGKVIAPSAQAKVYEKALKPAEEAFLNSRVGKHLSMNAGGPELKAIREMVVGEMRGQPDLVEKIATDYRKRSQFMREVSKKYGIAKDEVDRMVSHIMEVKPDANAPAHLQLQYQRMEDAFNPTHYAQLKNDPEINYFANEVKDLMTEIADKETKAGVLNKVFETDTLDYLTHLITPEGRAAMKKVGKDKFQTKLLSVFHPSTLSRKLVVPDEDYIRTVLASPQMAPPVKPNAGGKAAKLSAAERASEKARKQLEQTLIDISDPVKLSKMPWKEKKVLLDAGFLKYPAISEVNTLAREGKLFPGQKVDQFFYEDPAKIAAIRQMRSERSLTSARIMENARDMGMKDGWAKPWKKGEPIPEGYKLVNSPLTTDVVFPADVADHLNLSYRMLDDHKNLAGITKVYKKALQWWKVNTLMPFPAYHFRNVFGGNLWNQMLAGMNPATEGWWNKSGANHIALKVQKVKAGKDAGTLAGKGAKWANQTITSKTGAVYSLHEIDELARKGGIYKTAQYSGDMFGDWDDFLSKSVNWKSAKNYNPLRTYNNMTVTGMKVGSYLEDNAKLGTFIHFLKEGESPAEAARLAHKYIFDYFDVPPIVQASKSVMPFITWYYKNIPLQLEYMAKQPKYFQSAYKVKAGMSEGNIPDNEVTESYFKESYPLVYSKKDGKANWFALGRWLPMTDVNMLDPTNFGNIASMVWPGVRTPIEMSIGQDLYFKQPIYGKRIQMLGKYMPSWQAYLMRQFRLPNTLDVLNPGGIMGKEDKKAWFGLGQKRQSKFQPPEAARWTRFVSGLRTYQTDVGRAKSKKIIALEKEMIAKRGALKYEVDEKERKHKIKEIRELQQRLERLRAYKY